MHTIIARNGWVPNEFIPSFFPSRNACVNRSIDWQLSVRANCFIIGFVGRGKFGGDEKAGEKLCTNFPSFLFLPFWKISHEIRRVDIFTRILEKETTRDRVESWRDSICETSAYNWGVNQDVSAYVKRNAAMHLAGSRVIERNGTCADWR